MTDMTPREVFEAMIQHFDNDPTRWTQHAFAADKAGNPMTRTEVRSKSATCWCVIGALYYVTGNKTNSPLARFCCRILADARTGSVENSATCVEDCYHYNDANCKSIEDVIAWIRRAQEASPL